MAIWDNYKSPTYINRRGDDIERTRSKNIWQNLAGSAGRLADKIPGIRNVDFGISEMFGTPTAYAEDFDWQNAADQENYNNDVDYQKSVEAGIDPFSGQPLPNNPSQDTNNGSNPTTTGPSAQDIIDAQAYYQDQIDSLNRLLGATGGRLDTSLGILGANYNAQNTDLSNQRKKAMGLYDAQSLQNSKDKQSGLEQVDAFANNSYNSLMRLLGGAGAGNSSVARTLMPSLVSKAGSTRRTGVFNTAGENEMNIDTARTDAENQYTNELTALDEWKKAQEKSMRQETEEKNLDLLQQIQDAQFLRAQAGGGGYAEAKAAGANTASKISNTQAALDALFGAYNPTYTPKAINLTTPELSKYTVDPATIKTDASMPSDTSYYGGMLKKKKALTT